MIGRSSYIVCLAINTEMIDIDNIIIAKIEHIRDLFEPTVSLSEPIIVKILANEKEVNAVISLTI